MKNIGMIVAVEMDAALKKYGHSIENLDCKAFEVKRCEGDGYTLYIINSGAGEIAAAAATQFAISELGADMIVNFGVVGGLTPEMAVAKLCVVESVVHYDFDISDFEGCMPGQYSNYPSPYMRPSPELVAKAIAIEPELRPVVCASGDKFVSGVEKKSTLHRTWGADICEMESAGILLTCNRNGVPCLMIKAVSDAMDGGVGEFERELERCSEVCVNALHRVIMQLNI